jgi:hypothetical protein
MMVQSGPVGVHAYWRLREPLLANRPSRRNQKRLIATLDSDPAIHDRARIKRHPGYLNHNPDYPTPCLCEILRHDASRVYDLTEILEHLAELPTAVPATATATPRPATLLETRGRAALYAARWPGVAQGERNATAFLHVKQLVNDFELDDSAAWEIVSDWNRSNQPPLDDKELGLVFESAKNGASARPRGCKLKEPAPVRQEQTRPIRNKAVTLVQPANAVGILLEATITGKRRAIDWPMTDIGEITEALLPGTTTVLCGPKAVSKTFFLLQCFTFWMLHGVKCAVLILEESAEHCLWRCLAQLAGLPKLMKSSWVRTHRDLVRHAWDEYKETLDLLGAQLYDSPKDEMTLPEIAEWMRARGADGARLVIADPCTAAKQTDSPWKADTTFINTVKRHAGVLGFSALLATHHVKGGSTVPSLDSLAGSTAWARFAQTVLWLEGHDPKTFEVMLMENRIEVETNRTLHVLAARNDWGTGKRIAMNFTEQLRFESRGIILKSERKPKQ